MNLRRALIVARKDFEEFRKNKYILGTILIMPLMVAVVLPMIYVVPINQLGESHGNPLDLHLDVRVVYANVTISNATIFDARIENSTVVNTVLQGCFVIDSSISGANINGSEVYYSDVRNSLLINSNVYSPVKNDGNLLTDSQLIGEDGELKRLQDIMFNVLLILLIMIPVTIPTVTASYSFVGEKVNRSLEPLLATPITDLELLVGKSGSIFLMSMGATWAAFAVAIGMVDMLTYPVLGYNPLPTDYWMVGMLLLAPAMCILSILTNVIISSRVNDVRVSQQIGGVLVLPLLIFFFSSLAGVLSTGVGPLIIFSLGIFAADAGILWLSLRVFRREQILVNWVL